MPCLWLVRNPSVSFEGLAATSADGGHETVEAMKYFYSKQGCLHHPSNYALRCGSLTHHLPSPGAVTFGLQSRNYGRRCG